MADEIGVRVSARPLSDTDGDSDRSGVRVLRHGADELGRTQDVLATLAGKWVTALLFELRDGPRRNFQLRQAVGGISAKALSETLRRLVRDGMISHVVHEDSFGQVGLGYALSELGVAALELLEHVGVWAEAHHDEIEVNRAQLEGHLKVS